MGLRRRTRWAIFGPAPETGGMTECIAPLTALDTVKYVVFHDPGPDIAFTVSRLETLGKQGYFNAERDTLKAVDSDGFLFEAIVRNRAGGTISGRLESEPAEPFVWAGWESAPPWKESLKKSYYILKNARAGDADAGDADAGDADAGAAFR